MVFPEHMEFRYYVTPERKEHFALYDRTLGSRMTYLDQTQDLGQCLIDLYDTDFYDAYCTLAEINKLVQAEKDATAWKKLLELSMPLCEVHPFFGLLVKELSELESTYAHGQDADATIVLSFANDFEAIVRDAKALIERCLDDRYQPDYSTAERYREAHYDALLRFDDMGYGELATEEVMLDGPAYDSAPLQRGAAARAWHQDSTARGALSQHRARPLQLPESLLSPPAAPDPQVQKLRQVLCCDRQHHAGLLHAADGRLGKNLPPDGSGSAVSESADEEPRHEGVYTLLQGPQRPRAVWNDDQGRVHRMVEGSACKACRLRSRQAAA